MISSRSDTELQLLADDVIKMYPWFLHPKSAVSTVIQSFFKYTTNSIDVKDERPWQIKIQVLSLFQIFYVQHLHFLAPDLKLEIIDWLCILIEDYQLEVSFFLILGSTNSI